jgi:protein phosphatase 2C family protein 2/3
LPFTAEFRGPGVHHNYEDSDSGYEVDADNKGKSFGVGGYKGRIIFLGDGTEVLTDSDDTEMFDNADEDKDLASQVAKSSSSSNSSETTAVVAKDTGSTDTNKTESTAVSTSADAKKTDETTKAESKKD